jgi:hypothetical protein
MSPPKICTSTHFAAVDLLPVAWVTPPISPTDFGVLSRRGVTVGMNNADSIKRTNKKSDISEWQISSDMSDVSEKLK